MKIYNLTYTIGAIDRPILWFNLWNIKKHLNRFNGRKLISVVMMGNNTGTRNMANLNEAEWDSSVVRRHELVEKIQRYLSDPDIIYLISENTERCEAPLFMDVMGPMIESTHSNEATMYSHTKGVRHTGLAGSRSPIALALWTGNLYSQVFDDFPDVEQKLWIDGKGAYGAYKQDGEVSILSGTPVPWHFSGAFFWFRHDRFFNRSWKCDEPSRGVTEYMLPRIMSSDECYGKYVQPDFNQSGEFYEVEPWRRYYRSQGLTIDQAMNNFGFDGNELNGFTFTKHI